ncbi:netrin-4-like [Gadus macrocephalus]|uniref:netrin-4-like n=1 Tax=Gadus macrocephalus TaxID=80720 RepID=UPI0028CB41E7|nr:netrin-4-like [Gadus macrocephalus]
MERIEHYEQLYWIFKNQSSLAKPGIYRSSLLFLFLPGPQWLKVKVLSAHDKGLPRRGGGQGSEGPSAGHQGAAGGRAGHPLPRVLDRRGCTCPILNPGAEYLVGGHSDRKAGRLLVNMKSLVLPWKASLGRKLLPLLRKDCSW